MKSAALSANITIGALVLDEVTTGIAEASATLRFLIPITWSLLFTTVHLSPTGPILKVLAWWFSAPVFHRMAQRQYSSESKLKKKYYDPNEDKNEYSEQGCNQQYYYNNSAKHVTMFKATIYIKIQIVQDGIILVYRSCILSNLFFDGNNLVRDRYLNILVFIILLTYVYPRNLQTSYCHIQDPTYPSM